MNSRDLSRDRVGHFKYRRIRKKIVDIIKILKSCEIFAMSFAIFNGVILSTKSK